MNTIRPATADDLNDVLALLNGTSRWLKSRGLDQWGNGFGADRIGPMVDRREVYIVHDGDTPIATAAASTDGDTDFWTDAELAENAVYLNKVTIARNRAGNGLGTMLFRWLVDRAARQGADLVRLDAWRTNRDLHAYYERTGWRYVRTVEREHRRSGALFQRAAALDTEAWMSFMWTGTELNADERYAPGQRVIFSVDGADREGEVASTYGLEWTCETPTAPPPMYVIHSGGRRYDLSHHEVRRPATLRRSELRQTV
jgi:GNAT superfamily N-acetyltransferase